MERAAPLHSRKGAAFVLGAHLLPRPTLLGCRREVPASGGWRVLAVILPNVC